MVHTRYHFRIHADQLPGALSRLGALLSCPLFNPDSASREVENIQAEFSRNCNSDSRKQLQLRRSLGLPPYSSFSTGSIETLRDRPLGEGRDPVAALKELWGNYYTGERLDSQLMLYVYSDAAAWQLPQGNIQLKCDDRTHNMQDLCCSYFCSATFLLLSSNDDAPFEHHGGTEPLTKPMLKSCDSSFASHGQLIKHATMISKAKQLDSFQLETDKSTW
jgi:hypothetical protein